MPVRLSPDHLAELVTRLRTAGCVFAEDEAELIVDAAYSPAELDRLAQRRITGEPLEQILGWVLFAGLRVAVAPGVFVPRRRTEHLVAQAVERLAIGDRVLDLCCGCGAVGLAIASMVPAIELHATELDPVAVACAGRNLGPTATVYVGDLFAPLPQALRGQFDVVVANVPYVPTASIATMPAEARQHEPRRALDGGADGLAILRRVAAEAPAWLRPGGALLIETSDRQASAAAAAFAGAGLTSDVRANGDLGATIVLGTLPV